MPSSTSRAITQGILVSVRAEYVPDHSKPHEDLYFFVYHVTISNEGEEPAKLLTRHWIITDANGEEQHVRGPGVIGEQPYLKPGDIFRYTSACPLATPVGSMRGSYQMVRPSGQLFDALVDVFTLATPHALN